jgi:hypothetical protein
MDTKKKIEAIPPQRTRKELWEQLVSAGCNIGDSTFYSKCKGFQPLAKAGPDRLWRLDMAVAKTILKDHSGNLIFGDSETTATWAQRKLQADVRRKEALANEAERLEKEAQGKVIPAEEFERKLLTLICALQLRINDAVDTAAPAQVTLVGGQPARAHALAADLKQLVRRAIAGLLADGPLRVTIDPVQPALPPQDDKAHP